MDGPRQGGGQIDDGYPRGPVPWVPLGLSPPPRQRSPWPGPPTCWPGRSACAAPSSRSSACGRKGSGGQRCLVGSPWPPACSQQSPPTPCTGGSEIPQDPETPRDAPTLSAHPPSPFCSTAPCTRMGTRETGTLTSELCREGAEQRQNTTAGLIPTPRAHGDHSSTPIPPLSHPQSPQSRRHRVKPDSGCVQGTPPTIPSATSPEWHPPHGMGQGKGQIQPRGQEHVGHKQGPEAGDAAATRLVVARWWHGRASAA